MDTIITITELRLVRLMGSPSPINLTANICFIFNDRYKAGLSSLRKNVTNMPKQVAGPTPDKVQFLVHNQLKAIKKITRLFSISMLASIAKWVENYLQVTKNKMQLCFIYRFSMYIIQGVEQLSYSNIISLSQK